MRLNRVVLIGRGIIALFTVLSLGGAIGGTELVDRVAIAHAVSAVGTFLETPSKIGVSFSYDRIMYIIILFYVSAVIADGIRNRHNPLTVLKSERILEFRDDTGENVLLHNTQYLRANHPKVTAYYTYVSTEFGGTIPRDRIRMLSFSGEDQFINSHIQISPTPSNNSAEIPISSKTGCHLRYLTY